MDENGCKKAVNAENAPFGPLDDENDDEAEESVSIADEQDDESSDEEAEVGETDLLLVEENIPIRVLEGDAAEICRKKANDEEHIETFEHILSAITTQKKRKALDDDEEDFFEDFIDDDDAYANVDEKQVWLDAYNADLHLRILPDNRLIAEPLCEDGFAYMIAGVRASYGVNSGRIGFEIKVLDNLDISQVKPEETHFPHELRVGWSTDTASLILGESHYGYGYCGSTGKKATQWRFSAYGPAFGEFGDVIGCLVDFATKEIEFMKNGERLGKAFVLGEEWDSWGPPLFPHVATKNIRFEANFGQLNKPWYGLPEDYKFINDVPLEARIRGPVPPASKKDCTVIMVVGLPGCGKTTWVERFCESNQEQRWHVLSSPMVLEHMKVQGTSRKKLTQSRWDIVMGATVKCLNKLMTLACRKKKNYIIDQTNCYPLPRKKKMTAFKDFYRKAVVIVPTEEAHADRQHRQAMTDGKQMPPEAMLEMKACFVLPKEEDELFDEIEFVELQRDDAQRVVEHFNEEGKAFKPPEQKKRRGSDWSQQENQSTRKEQQGSAAAVASSHRHSDSGHPMQPTTPLDYSQANAASIPAWLPAALSKVQQQIMQSKTSQPMTPDQLSYQHTYYHAYSYRHYNSYVPRTGWPSGWPQAQWNSQQTGTSPVESPSASVNASSTGSFETAVPSNATQSAENQHQDQTQPSNSS